MNKISFLILCTLMNLQVYAQVKTTEIYKASDIIWGMTFVDNTNVILSLRGGEILLLDIVTKKTRKLKAPKVVEKGQGGLLDVKLKKIADKTYLYYTFSDFVKETLVTKLGRAQFVNEDLVDHEILFQAKQVSSNTRHFGSRLLFKDDLIFMTVGDRDNREFAQNLEYHSGKILRLTLEGKPASGNPFLNQSKVLPEIWSYGHRNPQGITLDLRDGSIYSSEFGPRGGDEVNIIEASKNYGWPVITYGLEYWGPKIGETHKEGMEQPLVYWTPSISPSGMVFYNADKFPKWRGSLFVANLSSRHLRRLEIQNKKVIKQEVLLSDLKERIRHVEVAPDGQLYVSTDSGKFISVSLNN